MYFLHFRNAQSPCNEEYKHESAIAHSLARAKHRKMLNDMELNQFSDVSQYYQQNIDRMTKSARYVVFSWKKNFNFPFHYFFFFNLPPGMQPNSLVMIITWLGICDKK